MPETALTTIDQDNIPEPHQPKVSVEQVFKLRTVNGLSERQIAKMLGVTKNAIHYHIVKHDIPSKNDLEAFRNGRGDLFANMQRNIANSIDLETIKSASFLQRMTAIGVAYDKERLERDLSTNNVSVMHATDYTKDIEALDAEYEELSNQ